MVRTGLWGGSAVFGLFLALSVSTKPVVFPAHQQELVLPEVPTVSLPPVQEVSCLAKNIYFEARGEPELGQRAVAFVTLNRTKSGSFPSTICDVVYQKTDGFCQFAWVCTGLKVLDQVAFDKAYQLAYDTIAAAPDDPTHGALYFNTTPFKYKHKTAHIGNHIFYK